MGLFGKKRETADNNTENDTLHSTREELEAQVDTLQSRLETKQDAVNEIMQKISLVKEEYAATVSGVMTVKKELNQKKMELDVVKREYRSIQERIKNSEQLKDVEVVKFNKTEENFSKIKKELDEMTKKRDEVKAEFEKSQSDIHTIRKQHIDAQSELDEANSRLYNAKEELEKKDQFQDTQILTTTEKELIKGDDKNSAGIIEAASAVVGSLKSKLSMTQKELEAIQILLEKERREHEAVKEELEQLQALNLES